MVETKYLPRVPYDSPLIVNWDITEACNARCIMCYSSSSKRSQGELNTLEAIKLIDDLKKAGILHISIVGGEPFLRKDIIEIARHICNKNISIGIATNGLLVNEKIVEELSGINITRLTVSLHSTQEALHDQIVGVPGTYKKALRVLEMAKELGITTAISTTLMNLNFEQIDGIIHLALEVGASYHSTSLFVAVGRGTLGYDLTSEQYRSFFERWKKWREDFEGHLILSTHHETLYCLVDPTYGQNPAVVGCTAGWSSLRITSTGDVTPCNLLPISIGNIRETSIDDLWTKSPILRQLRNRNSLEGRCGICEYRHVCGGCRSTAFAYYGNLMGEDPRCWHQPSTATNSSERR